MKAKKIVGIVTTVAVLATSLSGCALLGGKDKAAIEEAATGYVDAIRDGKLKNSKKYVVDEEDYFQENELPSQQQELVNAVLEASSYEVEDVEVNKTKASANVVFTMPDLESIADEGYSFDEFIEAIEDIDDEVEESVSFSFVKDGEDWLIKADSTEDFYEFLMGIGEGIEFSGLSEAAAIEAVDTFVDYLRDGDLESAIAISSSDTDINDYQSQMSMFGDAVVGVMSAYFSNVEYTSEVTETNEDSITVALTGTAPDAANAIQAAFADVDTMAPVMADVMEALNDGGDLNSAYESIFAVASSAVQSADSTAYSTTAVVTADEDGNLQVDPGENFFFDMDAINIDEALDSEELMMATYAILLERGSITQAEYDAITGNSSSSGSDITVIEVETGDDYFSSSCYTSVRGIEFIVVTWDYYNTGDTFDYEVSYNGTDDFITGTYVIPDDVEDHIEILIPPFADDMSGDYIITVYDEGSSSSVLGKFEIVILGEGAPVGGGDAVLPAFGTSASYEAVSDDFYSFHFVDGNDNWISQGETLSSNRGEIEFDARTWAYYDIGATMNCDVYCDGEYLETITVVNDDDYEDTFEFEYEPSYFNTGDYTFVIYDVDDTSVFAYAFATVN
ncbi:MAG: hypothetical protein IJ757_07940 [Clostridiales bacterium]|nr:hypothetical protein [Clostridiales bacterium]